MMRSLRAFVLLLVCVNNAAAFESAEHQQLADLSYHLAMKIFCAPNPTVDLCLSKAAEKTFFDPVGNWIDYKTMDQIWGLSYGIDNMTFGDAQNRKLLTLETMVQGKASYQQCR
jgi:hypothetical protein